MAGPSRYLHIHEFRVFGLLWRIKNAPHSISEIRCKITAFSRITQGNYRVFSIH